MALTLIRTTDTVDLVHSDDPSVQAADGIDGWFVPTDGTPKGATCITIRPLNGWELLKVQGSTALTDGPAGQGDYVREVLSMGLVAIDGDPTAVAAFLDSPNPDHLFGVFTAIMECGAVPFVRGPDSGSTVPA